MASGWRRPSASSGRRSPGARESVSPLETSSSLCPQHLGTALDQGLQPFFEALESHILYLSTSQTLTQKNLLRVCCFAEENPPQQSEELLEVST